MNQVLTMDELHTGNNSCHVSTHTHILLFHSAAPQQSAYSMFVHTVLTLHLVTGLDTTATLFISMKQTVHKLLDASLSFKGGERMF